MVRRLIIFERRKTMDRKVDNIVIENAQIMFRNFSGNPGKFNAEGKRNFCVVIPNDEMANTLEQDGWNIKWTKPRDDGEDPKPYLPVAVNYGVMPPKIYMITANNKNLLNEDTVGSLDYAEIKNIDIIIRPYCWEVNGKFGVKAYVKNMYVTIEEDYFADKYKFSDPINDDDLPF
jgi:hypothetical protein